MIHIKQIYCVHTGTDGRGRSDDFVAAVGSDDFVAAVADD